MSDRGEDVGMAATMFAVDGAVVEAALGQNDPREGDSWAGDLSSSPRHVIPGAHGVGALNAMSNEATVPISSSDVGDVDDWDEDTPTDGAERSWASAPEGEGMESARASDQGRSPRRVSAPEPRVPSFSADAVVPSSSPDSASAPAPTRRAAPVAEAGSPRSSFVRGGASREASARESAVLLSTADVDRDDTPVDVLSVRVEGATYAAAIDALKRQLCLDCASLGGDAMMRLRLEREEGGRVVYGTGMVVRRGRR